MDRTDPINIDGFRQQASFRRDSDMRRQLHLSLIIVVVLLSATVGSLLSMAAPSGDEPRAQSKKISVLHLA